MHSHKRPLPLISLCCGLIGFAAIASAGVPTRDARLTLDGQTAPYEIAGTMPLEWHREQLNNTTSVQAINQSLAATSNSAADISASAPASDSQEIADLIPDEDTIDPMVASGTALKTPDQPIQMAALSTSMMTEGLAEETVVEPPLLNAAPLGLLDRAVAFFTVPDRKPDPPTARDEGLIGSPLPSDNLERAQSVAALASNLADGQPGDRLIERAVTVGRGDTLMKLLVGESVPRSAAHDAINALRAHYNPRRLKVGQQLALLFSADQNANGQRMEPTFVGLRIDPAIDQRVEVSRQDHGGFTAELFERPLKVVDQWAMAKIDGSLMNAGRKADVPAAVLTE